MAQLALTLGGAFAGNALVPGIGGQVGFALGAVAYQAFFAQDVNQTAPRIEGQVTSSAYGQILPRVWGIYPVAGNIIDASSVRVVSDTEEQGGKGGPTTSYTTHQYFADIAVAVHDGEIDAVLQIRAQGKIIFDASSDAEVVKPEWLDFKLYTGTETQSPDPTLEAEHGAGNVPGYRGTAYVVFKNFPLSEFGMSEQVAISFEFLIAVSASSATTLQNTQVAATGEASDNVGGLLEPYTGLLIFPIGATGAQTYDVTAVDPYTRSIVWQLPATTLSYYKKPALRPRVIETAQGTIAVPGEVAFVETTSTGDRIVEVDPVSGAIIRTSAVKTTTSRFLVNLEYDWHHTVGDATPFYLRDGGVLTQHFLFHGFDTQIEVDEPAGWYFDDMLCSNGSGKLLVGLQNQVSSSTLFAFTILDSATLTMTAPTSMAARAAAFEATGDTWWVVVGETPLELIEVDETGTILQTVNFSTDYSITDNFNLEKELGLLYEATGNLLFVQGEDALYAISLSDTSIAPKQYPITSTTLTPIAMHDESCRIWYSPYLSVNASSANLCAQTGALATLDQVVSDLSIDGTELVAGDIDVTALSAISVRGIGVTSAMARRNVIAMLQVAYMFDYVPRSAKLTAVLRGGSSSATLTEDEIGAHIDGSDQPEPWTIKRAPGNALPNQFEVTFVDPDHNYEATTQSARRQASDTGTVERLSLAVALTNDEGAQVADTYLHLRHIEAEQYATTTMPSTIDDVQPAAVLTTDYDGVEYTYRVANGSIIDGRMIEMVGLREVPEVFTSYAVGGDPRETLTTVKAIGQTILWPLDIPLLRSIDDDAGVYLAASSYTDGWPGCDVQRSTDGVDFSPVLSVTAEASIGSALTAPTTGEANKLDLVTSLNVSMINGSLSTGSRAAPTYAAWGQNGRFEIIAFITATQDADGWWTISNMVRGVSDTGHAISQHAVGDQFVILTESTLRRLVLSTTAIDGLEWVRGVTYNKTASSAVPVPYSFTAESLEPYAPCRLHAYKASGKWEISWTRQDRIKSRALWSPPMSEDAETYQIEILDDNSDVLRTILVTDATSYTYTQADQTTDEIADQEYLRFQIGQVSAATGVGHKTYELCGVYLGYPEAIIADGATHFWRLEESSGTTAEDFITGGVDGTYAGSYTLRQDPLSSSGKAVDFNVGSVEVDTTGFGADDIRTIEMFFKFTSNPSTSGFALFYSGNGSNLVHALVLNITTSGALRVRSHRSGGVNTADSTGTALSQNTDYHLIVTIDGTNGPLKVYLNDTLYLDLFMTGTWETSDVIHIGSDPAFSTPDFEGIIDEVSINPSIITSTQRADHFTRGGVA